jgi:hypothetical protein
MLTKIINIVKEKEGKLFVITSMILISFLVFFMISIYNRTQDKEPLIFIQEKTNQQ